MSLFDIFSPSKRRFHTALTALMAEYTYDRLSENDKKAIDASVKQVVERSGQSPLALYAMPSHYRFGLIAAALKEQGIAPAVPGEQWTIAGNPFAYGPEDEGFGGAMEEAYEYLKSKGIEI